MSLYWYACISTNTYCFKTHHISLETDWWALSNISLTIYEILANEDFTVTDDLISQSFVVTFVHPTYMWIALELLTCDSFISCNLLDGIDDTRSENLIFIVSLTGRGSWNFRTEDVAYLSNMDLRAPTSPASKRVRPRTRIFSPAVMTEVLTLLRLSIILTMFPRLWLISPWIYHQPLSRRSTLPLGCMRSRVRLTKSPHTSNQKFNSIVKSVNNSLFHHSLIRLPFPDLPTQTEL